MLKEFAQQKTISISEWVEPILSLLQLKKSKTQKSYNPHINNKTFKVT